MADSGGSAVWPARLRWRLRGALLWPLFWTLTLLDAVLLAVLPISGTGPPFVGALLLAGFINLIGVAVLGRVGAWALRRRDPAVPGIVAEDRAGCVLLLTVTATLVAGGVLHAPARDAAERALRRQADVVRAYVLAHGAPEYRAHIGQLDTQQHGDDFFRTCVPGDEGDHPLCLLIDTSHDPPLVRLDQDRTPNRHL
jgi:hypothetical protein